MQPIGCNTIKRSFIHSTAVSTKHNQSLTGVICKLRERSRRAGAKKSAYDVSTVECGRPGSQSKSLVSTRPIHLPTQTHQHYSHHHCCWSLCLVIEVQGYRYVIKLSDQWKGPSEWNTSPSVALVSRNHRIDQSTDDTDVMWCDGNV